MGVLTALLIALACAKLWAQPAVPLEYQVKAVYLFNFLKFVEWPSSARAGPIIICVASQDPFGGALTDTVRDERISDRPLVTRLILEPESRCHVVFVPQGVTAVPYLRAARTSPTLTVGEQEGFISDGGIINFTLENGKVRFQISPQAAERAELRISSRLLRLSREVKNDR
jgi:hypothetical protein